MGKDTQHIEGFVTTESTIQPIRDYDIDFSLPPYKYDVYNVDEIYDQSISLIKKSPDHIYFDITCDNISVK